MAGGVNSGMGFCFRFFLGDFSSFGGYLIFKEFYTALLNALYNSCCSGLSKGGGKVKLGVLF